MQDTERSVQQLQLPPGCGDPIVEGDAHFIHPVEEVAESLAEMNNRKARALRHECDSGDVTQGGAWALKARRVLAWNLLFEDATRFDF
jgi:hypothetical protein